MRERLSSEPAPELVRYLYRPRLEHQQKTLYAPMLAANQAHVVMLVRQGIVDHKVGTSLLTGLQALADEGPEAVKWDPRLEEMYYNIEACLIERLGTEVAGRIHAGRSRNDLYAALTRMRVRGQLLDAAAGLLGFRERMLILGESHLETIMTGYTHSQPAQPITLGHYFCAITSALEGADRRFASAYETTNQSSLGACALAGTSFPIDRALVADLLGFDGVTANTIDAVASRDYIGDTLYALAMAGTLLSRLATDLYTWVSYEYGYLELSDAAAGTSSIMPQKKNPFALEHVRAKAAHLQSALLSAMGCWKNTAYSHNREISQESVLQTDESFLHLEAALGLMTACLRGLRVDRERMREALNRNFAVATDLADALVQEGGLPFRVAHQVVGAAVRELVGEPDTALDGEMVLDELDKRGLSVSLSGERLSQLASPEVAVARRSHLGGPAPSAVRQMVEEQRERLATDRQQWSDRRSSLGEAEERLREAVAAASVLPPSEA